MRGQHAGTSPWGVGVLPGASVLGGEVRSISEVLGATGVHKAGAPMSPTGVVTPMAGEGGELVTECVPV